MVCIGQVELIGGELRTVNQINFFILELVFSFLNLVNVTNQQHPMVERQGSSLTHSGPAPGGRWRKAWAQLPGMAFIMGVSVPRSPNSSKKVLINVMTVERMINFCLAKSLGIKSKYLTITMFPCFPGQSEDEVTYARKETVV